MILCFSELLFLGVFGNYGELWELWCQTRMARSYTAARHDL